MKCDICGKEGAEFVSQADGLWAYWLCPDHQERVKSYIESMKPKVKVTKHDGYVLESPSWCIGSGEAAGTRAVHCNRMHLRQEAADALYEYMAQEKHTYTPEEKVGTFIRRMRREHGEE